MAHPIITVTGWLSPAIPATVEGGTSVRSLPGVLSGKIQQCFCSMPGNTFQETRGMVGRRRREGKMLTPQQLKADELRGAETPVTIRRSSSHLYLRLSSLQPQQDPHVKH